MLVDAKLRYTRIAPRKVRMVANLIRGMRAVEAQETLKFVVKRSSNPILKLLNSAIANAENNFNLKKENLYISEIRVDGGPIIKRFRARARGSASPIQKKTSHISIKLGEIEEGEIKGVKKASKKKQEKIKKVYSQEKPKEGVSKKDSKKQSIEKEQIKEPKKEAKGEKRQIFRRKSI